MWKGIGHEELWRSAKFFSPNVSERIDEDELVGRRHRPKLVVQWKATGLQVWIKVSKPSDPMTSFKTVGGRSEHKY